MIGPASFTGALCSLGTEWDHVSIPLQAPLLIQSWLVPSALLPLPLPLSLPLCPCSTSPLCWHVVITRPSSLVLNHIQWWNGLKTQPVTSEAVFLGRILQYVFKSGHVCTDFPMQLCGKPCSVCVCVCVDRDELSKVHVLKVWRVVCGCIVGSKGMRFPSQTKLICLCMSFGQATINTGSPQGINKHVYTCVRTHTQYPYMIMDARPHCNDIIMTSLY